MDLSFLPIKIKNAINNINLDKLYEIRLRENQFVLLNYSFKSYFLTNNGLSDLSIDAIKCTANDIQEIINNVTEYSIYAFNDRIKQGYITTFDGVRIGIAGECVFDEERISTIKNISSLLIRIPHLIFGCAKKIAEEITNEYEIYSTIICSPPFSGKTTILKDLARILNDKVNKSILIIDERGEFFSVNGVNIDKISYSNKQYAFNYAVRSLSPKIVITDELAGESDFICAENVVNSGVKIIASCHADNLNSLICRHYFKKGLFDRYVFLDEYQNPGVIKKIYDKDFNEI